MARLPRLDVPGVPQHVVQRGHDRLPCFAAQDDYIRYRQELREALLRHACRLHAYVLMTNHVHLLLTPDAPGAISKVIQMIGRRYVASFNARYHRSGTLWEGRFKSCLVDSEHYLLRCYRYIELNPIRAGIVASAVEYPWSSYHSNALGKRDALVTPHESFLALGQHAEERRVAYAAIIAEATCTEELGSIRQHLQQGRAWGSHRFQTHIEALHGRCVVVRPRGRPSQRA